MSYLCETVRCLPVILVCFVPIAFFITYGIAVGKDHVSALWPYISDTGTLPPESCVFSLLLNAASYALCVIIYLRLCQVSDIVKIKKEVRITRLWNRASAFFGYLSCFGLNLVANFQETNEFLVHIIGALLCFFSGTLYFLLQTIFTRRLCPSAKLMLWLRIIFTVLNVLFIIGTFAPINAAIEGYNKGQPGLSPAPRTWGNMLKWSSKDGGFAYHITSTVSEWLLVFSFCAYICTIFWDFKKIKIEPIRIKFLDLEEATPQENQQEQHAGKSMWI